MFTSYSDAVQYLYANLPMFQRVGAAALKKDLTNTLKLCAALGNPHQKFKSVHIAGTNGKGSTAHMLASILQSSGYRTGLYTSPHLKEFTERIKINGAEVTQAFVVEFVNRVKPLIEAIQPSFFEITVAMAFQYFSEEKVDIAVIEVGLGGRLDSTNVITPEVSVITNIGWDHKDLLGNTLQQIAGEKAGIIKPSVPVVVSERQPEVEKVFTEKSNTVGSPLFFASDHYSAENGKADTLTVLKDQLPVYPSVKLPLRGAYQKQNVAGVVKAVEILREKGFTISDSAVRQGFEKVMVQTGLKGRWQVLGERPLVVCDTGHNIDGIRYVVQQLKTLPCDKLHMVIGMVKDKDITEVLSVLPKEAAYYFCQAKLPRALDAGELAQRASACGLTGCVVPDVNDAKNKARQNAGASDVIFIGGSTFVVAELEEL